MSDKEILLKMLNGEMQEKVPFSPRCVQIGFNNGFGERPPFNRGGVDWFGVHWFYEPATDSIVPDPHRPYIMEEIGQWREKVTFPDLDQWDWSRCRERDGLDRIDREGKLSDLMLPFGPFERLHLLMGFENALCALLTDPDEVSAYLDAFMDYKLKLIDKIAEHYHPDMINFQDDYGTQQGLFFSPELWRKLFKPQLQKAVDRCHEHGILFEMHSCGKVSDLIPDFAEMGCDSFHGMNIVDVPRMKAITGTKIVYHTTLDYQRYQAAALSGTLTEEALRRDVRESLAANAKGGFYVPRSVMEKDWWVNVMTEEIIAFCDAQRIS